MQPGEPTDPALISLLAFWADAGVEYAYADAPIDRLKPPPPPEPSSRAPAAAPPPAAPRAPASLAPDLKPEIERARAAAAATLDLAQLEQAIRAFETPLKPRNPRLVFARGALAGPAVVVIGQGPTAEDESAGEPFSGRAGRLLDRMLVAAGLSGQALILNTAFWRAGGRSATGDVEAVCFPFVERALALSRPRALLLAGEGAVRALTGQTEPILAARGRWLAWRPAADPDGEPLPALPIFHPDFLMRQPAAKKRAWVDLLSLADRLAEA